MDHLSVFYAQFFKTVKYFLYLFLMQFSRTLKIIKGPFFACHLRKLNFVFSKLSVPGMKSFTF